MVRGSNPVCAIPFFIGSKDNYVVKKLGKVGRSTCRKEIIAKKLGQHVTSMSSEAKKGEREREREREKKRDLEIY